MSRVDQRDPQKVYHRVDRAELARMAPSFPWRAYLEELGFPGIQAVNVYEPEYIGLLEKRFAVAPRFRVNGSLANVGEFATAFSCEAGDAMIRPPEKQCAVW